MDRERLRELLRQGIQDGWDDKSHGETWGAFKDKAVNRILAIPEIARALDVLADLEAGKLVRLADDQRFPKNLFVHPGEYIGFDGGL